MKDKAENAMAIIFIVAVVVSPVLLVIDYIKYMITLINLL